MEMLSMEEAKISKELREKIEVAVQRLKAFEPEDGYYLAFSGGKDSQTVYHLCQLAGVKFEAHYNVESVGAPEQMQFIKKKYPDCKWDFPRYADGTVVTMWNLIPKRRMPPTRIGRYCCQFLKESAGKGKITLTGVRWAESPKRARSHGVISFWNKPRHTEKMAIQMGANYKINDKGSVILNDDNDEARRMVEHCYRTNKTMLNPIVDWTDSDVWFFLNGFGIEHCCLYDQGYTRIGCVGCPMSMNAAIELERYPKIKQAYLRAFEKMLENNKRDGIYNKFNWQTAQDVYDWWMNDGKKKKVKNLEPEESVEP